MFDMKLIFEIHFLIQGNNFKNTKSPLKYLKH